MESRLDLVIISHIVNQINAILPVGVYYKFCTVSDFIGFISKTLESSLCFILFSADLSLSL